MHRAKTSLSAARAIAPCALLQRAQPARAGEGAGVAFGRPRRADGERSEALLRATEPRGESASCRGEEEREEAMRSGTFRRRPCLSAVATKGGAGTLEQTLAWRLA
ncbi:unnamed protein product [Prorocentrum cordatum]|uniref:Uncharacterized protein n=1 Tax=Prorocentrum cordatum TaxID=2364126 RepID=A0ABN9V2F3_9DINO|nr:unnamed protein product [Polarella glacialis]